MVTWKNLPLLRATFICLPRNSFHKLIKEIKVVHLMLGSISISIIQTIIRSLIIITKISLLKILEQTKIFINLNLSCLWSNSRHKIKLTVQNRIMTITSSSRTWWEVSMAHLANMVSDKDRRTWLSRILAKSKWAHRTKITLWLCLITMVVMVVRHSNSIRAATSNILMHIRIILRMVIVTTNAIIV